MKKLLIICVLLAGVTMLAQESGDRHHGRNFLKDMTPEQMATLSSKRLSLALDLTEEQRGQVMELQLERAKERKAFMEERKNSEGSGKALSPEDRFNKLNDRLDKKLAYKVSMKKILSETQYTRWENMHDHSKRKGQMDRRHHRHTGKK
jgi:hypothetical protein